MKNNIIKFTLCNGRTCSCPDLIINNDKVEIIDDYNNKVIMTKEHLKILADYLIDNYDTIFKK